MMQPSAIGLYYRGAIYHFFLEMTFFVVEFNLSHGKASRGISVLLKNEAFSYSVWLSKLMTHLHLICSIFRLSG